MFSGDAHILAWTPSPSLRGSGLKSVEILNEIRAILSPSLRGSGLK